MASSLKSVITAAIMKVTTDEKYKGIVVSTAEEARAEFIRALLSELFPDTEPPYVAPTVTTVDQLTEALEKLAVSSPAPAAEKKKPGRKPKVDADGNPVAKKPRAKKETGPVNIEKLNPTQTKRFKALCQEKKIEDDKKALVAYLNEMSKEEFDAKSFDDHIKTYVSDRPSNAAAGSSSSKPAEEEKECICVEFKGVEYWVDTTASPAKVYVTNPDSGVDEYMGNVGFGEFAEMTVPKEA